MSALASYFELTKPRILPMVVLSGLPALFLAAEGSPSLWVAVATLVGIVLAASAANSLNGYLERDLDARMERTRSRPLPSGRLRPAQALVFGLGLACLGMATLYWVSGPLAAGIALSAIFFYVFVYTLWLKPRTPVAVIVGGIPGAIAPLIADAAMGGGVGAAGWLLFAIVFFWQPPHFYAIALYRSEDYAAAGFPMLHDRIGEPATRRRIIAWIYALVPVTLLPVAISSLGTVYAVGAIALGGWFLLEAFRLQREPSKRAARRTLLVSLAYLLGIFVCMLADLAVSAVGLAFVAGSS